MKKLLESARRFYGLEPKAPRRGTGQEARPRPRQEAPDQEQRHGPVTEYPPVVVAEEPESEAPAGMVHQAPPTEDPQRLGREQWSEQQETVQPVAARSFSGRTLLVLLVAAALVLPLAPTVQRYLEQKAEIAALEQRIETLQERQQELQAQEKLWQQEAYVEQQARERLMYVKPGEIPFTVIGAEGQVQAEDSSAEVRTSKGPDWAEQLWGSLFPESGEQNTDRQGTDQQNTDQQSATEPAG